MAGSNLKNNKSQNPFLDSNFTKLFNELYTPLCRYCMNMVGEKDYAEDIVLEQFVYIWEHRERLGEHKSIKSYLFTAVKHRSINHLKKQFSRNSAYCIESLPEKSLQGKIPDPSDLLENKELGLILENALAQLPEKCRIIFTMKKIGEYTNKEIAHNLDISIKTVENQMTIAFKKLMTFVSTHWTFIFLFLVFRFRIFL
jgi:RNA polymerase sigma-70 factor, ECF subfamily